MDGLSLGRVVTALAEADPDRPALTGWEADGSVRTVTRAELDRRTNRIARAWAAMGVDEGDYVTIALPNSVGFFEAAVAAWKLGAVPQPLSSSPARPGGSARSSSSPTRSSSSAPTLRRTPSV